jgi:hypothetical protein
MPLVLRASLDRSRLTRPAISCVHDIVASTTSRPTFVTIAKRPSVWAGREKEGTDFGKTEAKYFSREDWTGGITLKRLTKFVFARTRFSGI